MNQPVPEATISRGNIYATLKHADSELGWKIRHFVADYLAFDEPGSYFKRHNLQQHGLAADGRLHLFREAAGMFPAGFVPMVCKAIKAEYGVDVLVADTRVVPVQPDPSVDLSWLVQDPKWIHQLEAVARVEQKGRGILWIPTGGGKTEIAVALALRIPCTWLLVVPGKDLMHNAAERWERITGQEAGRIGDGQWSIGQRFTAATFNTLARRLADKDPDTINLLQAIEGVFVDECHTLPAATFYKVTMRTNRAYYRVGLSGTPMARGDRKSVYAIGCLGPIIYRVLPQTLIDRGVIAKPRIRMVHHYGTSDAPTYQGAYGELVVRSTDRNRKLVAIAKVAARPGLIFVKQENHGHELTRRLQKVGLRVECAWGATKTTERNRLAKRLARGDLDFVVCSVIWQQGKNIPELRSVNVGAAGKSAIAAIQRVGRGSRTIAGVKDAFEVWDIFDTGNKWMERHAKTRRKAYKSEGYDVEELDVLPAAP